MEAQQGGGRRAGGSDQQPHHVILPWSLFVSLVKGQEDNPLDKALSCPDVLEQVLRNQVLCLQLLQDSRLAEDLRRAGLWEAVCRASEELQPKSPKMGKKTPEEKPHPGPETRKKSWMTEAFSKMKTRDRHDKNEQPQNLGEWSKAEGGSSKVGEGVALSGGSRVNRDLSYTQSYKQEIGVNNGVAAIGCGQVNHYSASANFEEHRRSRRRHSPEVSDF